jgi:hypothetical protein
VSQILFILLPTLLPEQHESVQCHIVAQMYAPVGPAEQSRYSQAFLLFSYFAFYATGTFLSSLSAKFISFCLVNVVMQRDRESCKILQLSPNEFIF